VARLRVFLSRFLGLFSSSVRRDRELRAEIDAHIKEAIAEHVRQGMTSDKARRTALREFGGVTQTIEALRDQFRFPFFSTLRQDLQYAVRTLTRTPGFAIVVSLMATPVLQSMLINLPATDPVTFVGVSVLLIAIPLVACYVPARRATRIDPIATLRSE
jgi:hypothetical protein